MTKTILHVDMNSYFATAEQQLNPKLRNKPIGVIKATGRTCIIAASKEAKTYGIKTGTTTWEAKKLCPDIVFIPAQMAKYLAMTKKLIELAKLFSPDIEVFSIDELFADISDTQKLYPGGAFQLALEFKHQITKHIGDYMTASMGIGYTKLVAKTASEMHKPNGLTFLTEPQEALVLTSQLPVDALCGIGRSRSAWLKAKGLDTLEKARNYHDLPPDLTRLIWLTLDEPLNTQRSAASKSVSRTYTTYSLLTNQQKIKALIRNLIEEVCLSLRNMHMRARTLVLTTTGTNFAANFHIRQTLHQASNNSEFIFSCLTRSGLPTEVRFAGVWVANLQTDCQLSFLDKKPSADKAIDTVNRKFGLFTLYPASLLGQELIRPEITGFWCGERESNPHILADTGS